MKRETLKNILDFLKEKENKKLPKKWFESVKLYKLVQKLENHPDGTQYRHKGYLFLSHTNIKKLPNDLYVEGELRLDDTNITKLPDNLYVDGYLELTNCKQLTKLPDNLRIIGGFLALENCEKVTKLPNNLYVDDYLDLTGCRQLRELPDNLYVGRELYLENTPIAMKYTVEEIREIVASTGGEIIGEIFR
jgi:hypothetical protein